MHSAPAVEFPLGRSRFQTCLMGVVLSLVGTVVLLWFVLADGVDGRHWLALAWWLLAACWMGLEWWRTPQGTLFWGGAAWSLLIGLKSEPVVPRVVLDFQRMLLLRLQSTDQASWVWLDQSICPARWLALRRAVHEPVHRADPMVDLFRGER